MRQRRLVSLLASLAVLVQLGCETAATTEPKADVTADTATAADAGTDTQAGTDAQAGTDGLAGTDVAVATDTAAGTDASAESDVVATTDAGVGTDASGDTDTTADTDTPAGTDADVASGSDATGGSDAEGATDAVAATDSGTGSDADPGDTAAGSDDTATDPDAGETAGGTDATAGSDAIQVPPALVELSLDTTQLFEADAEVTFKGTLNQPALVVLPGATIFWGDGTQSSTGTITGGVEVTLTHQYAQLGQYTVTGELCVGLQCQTTTIGVVSVVCAEAGHDDCSGGIADGCETDVWNDEGHCGSCVVACATDVTACALAEVCDAGTCKPQYAQADTPCRPAEGPCDVTETCDGESAACPEDSVASPLVMCNESNGDCDLGAYCNGTDVTCPANTWLKGNICRQPEGACDVAETCTGDSPLCPDNMYADKATPCRPVDGPCDVTEVCDGIEPTCPDDAFATGEVCRPINGPCDVAESCSGDGAECPTDQFDDSGKTIAGGDCGTAGVCDGQSATGGSELESKGTLCRESTGDCDPPEFCDGETTACPQSSYAWYGKLCRAADNTCDLPEYCGFEADCPAPTYKTQFGFSYDYYVCNATYNPELDLNIPGNYCYNGGCGGPSNFYSAANNNICVADQSSQFYNPCLCQGKDGKTSAYVAGGQEVTSKFTFQVFDSKLGKEVAMRVNPAKVDGGIRITASIQLSNLKDRVAVVTRDGGPIHGVSFWYQPSLGQYGISGVGATIVTANGPATAALLAEATDVIEVDLTDDGDNLTFRAWKAGTSPDDAVTLQASSTFIAYMDAAPIGFQVTNDEFQPIEDAKITEYKVYRGNAAVTSLNRWNFDQNAENGMVYSDNLAPLTLAGGAQQVQAGDTDQQAVDLKAGYIDLGQSDFQTTGLRYTMDVYIDPDLAASIGSGSATLLSTYVAGEEMPWIAVRYTADGIILSSATTPGTPYPVEVGTWITVSINRVKTQIFMGEATATTLSINGTTIGFAIAPSDEVLPGNLYLGPVPGSTESPWIGLIDNLTVYPAGEDPAGLPACE